MEEKISKPDFIKKINEMMNICVFEKEGEEEKYIQQEKLIKEKEFQLWYEQNSGVPQRFWHKKLSDYKTDHNTPTGKEELEKNLNIVIEYINALKNNENKNLWICGNNGTGKSMLGSMIVRELRKGRFARSYEIEDEVEESKSFRAAESKHKIIEKYSNYSLLIIDEVGRFDNNGNELQILFRILNGRYEKELPTVLISNLDKKNLKNYLGKALYDRFIENCQSVDFTVDSYRKNLRKE